LEARMPRRSEGNRFIYFIVLILCAFFLSSCVDNKEHITVNKDGTGTLFSNLMIPKATTDMVDNMLGGFMQSMQQAAGDSDVEVPDLSKSSPAEEMFASKDDILQKAKNVGLGIEFTDFKKEVREDGLYVQYTLLFDDINKLFKSGIVGTGFDIVKDSDNRLICKLISNPKKAQESIAQLEEFQAQVDFNKDMPEDFPAPSSEGLPPHMLPQQKKMQEAMIEALRSLKMQFAITMPNELTETTGMFQKVDSSTAFIEISGDLIENPGLINKLYGISGEESHVSCEGDGVDFMPIETSLTDDIDEQQEMPLVDLLPIEVETAEVVPLEAAPIKSLTVEELPTEPLIIEEPVAERVYKKQELSAKPDAYQEITKKPEGIQSRVYLNTGSTFEGLITEETDEYIVINMRGIPFQYLRGEIAKIEHIKQ